MGHSNLHHAVDWTIHNFPICPPPLPSGFRIPSIGLVATILSPVWAFKSMAVLTAVPAFNSLLQNWPLLALALAFLWACHWVEVPGSKDPPRNLIIQRRNFSLLSSDCDHRPHQVDQSPRDHFPLGGSSYLVSGLQPWL